jgi:hypothetical protein
LRRREDSVGALRQFMLRDDPDTYAGQSSRRLDETSQNKS